MEAAKWPAYARRYNGIALVNYKRKDWYKQVDIPTKVVHGDSDVVSLLDSSARPLAARLPNSKPHVLKGVNNFVPTEAPDQLAAVVEHFANTILVSKH